MVRWLLLIALAAAGAGACTLFDEDPPDDSCTGDDDCFKAQGETCNMQTHQCQVRINPDAAVVVDGQPMDAPADAPVDTP